MDLLPFLCKNFVWLELGQVIVCKFTYASAMLCLEDAIFLESSTSSSSHLSHISSTEVQDLWRTV